MVRITTSPSASRGCAMKKRLSRQGGWCVTTFGRGSGSWWTSCSSMAVRRGIGADATPDQRTRGGDAVILEVKRADRHAMRSVPEVAAALDEGDARLRVDAFG